MKRALLMLFVALSLSGCGLTDALNTHITNPLNDQQVINIGNTIGAANAVVVGYAALPLCAKGTVLNADGSLCHQKNALVQADHAMHAALAAYTDLKVYQQAHPPGSTIIGGTFGTLVAQVNTAIDEVKKIISTYNMTGA